MTKKPIRQDIKNLSDLEKQIKNLKSGKKLKKMCQHLVSGWV